MGKTCAIEGCKSGTSDHRRKRKTSLFQVPKNPQRRQLWNAAMNQQFRDVDCVCEYHFHPSEVKKEDVISLSDGSIFVNPREKRRLNPSAVPTLMQENLKNIEPQEKLNGKMVTQRMEHSQQPNDTICKPPVQNEEIQQEKDTWNYTQNPQRKLNDKMVTQSIEHSQQLHDTILDPPVQNEEIQQEKDAQSNMWDPQGNALQIQQEEEVQEEQIQEEEVQEEESFDACGVEVNIEKSCGSFEVLRSSNVDLSDHDYATAFKDTTSMQYEDSFPLEEEETDVVERVTRFDDHLLACSDDEVVDKDTNKKHPRPHFTIEQLRNHLQEKCLPKSWAWSEDPADYDSLLLHQFDSISRQTKMIIEVHSDLYITLCTNNNEVRVLIDKPVDSLDRFNTVLKKATRVIACRGTEFTRERRSVNCEGFIRPDAEFLKRQRIPRCHACFQHRRRLLSRNRHRENPTRRNLKKILKGWGAVHTTPPEVLKILLDLMPLHVVIEAEARKAAYRLICGNQWKNKELLGHTRSLSDR